MYTSKKYFERLFTSEDNLWLKYGIQTYPSLSQLHDLFVTYYEEMAESDKAEDVERFLENKIIIHDKMLIEMIKDADKLKSKIFELLKTIEEMKEDKKNG